MNFTVASNVERVSSMPVTLKLDSRIFATCEAAFPSSPAFATYLAKRIAAQNGSVLVAQLFINQFRACFPDLTETISSEQTARLGVDQNPNFVTAVFTALLMSGFPIMEVLTRFEINLKGDIESDDAEFYTQTQPKAVDIKQLVPFQHLFICASAMLAGITIDPRAQAT